MSFLKQKGLPLVLPPEIVQNLLLEFKLIKKFATRQDSSLALPNNAFNLYAWLQQALTLLGVTVPTPALPVIPDPILWQKMLIVAPNGNDTTAVRGRLDLPYLTIAAAVTAAQSFDTIYITPGTYTTTSLIKPNVSVYMEPGVQVTFTGATLDFGGRAGIYGMGDITFSGGNKSIIGDEINFHARTLFITNNTVTISSNYNLEFKVDMIYKTDISTIIYDGTGVSTDYKNARFNISNMMDSNTASLCFQVKNLSKGSVEINVLDVQLQRLVAEGFINTEANAADSIIKCNVSKFITTSPNTVLNAEYPIVTDNLCYAIKDYKFLNIETTGLLYKPLATVTAGIEKGTMYFAGRLNNFAGTGINSYIDFSKEQQAVHFIVDVVDKTLNSSAILDLTSGEVIPLQRVSGRIEGRPSVGTNGVVEYNASFNGVVPIENLTILSNLKPSFRNKAIGATKMNIKSAYANQNISVDNGGITYNYGTIIVNANIV